MVEKRLISTFGYINNIQTKNEYIIESDERVLNGKTATTYLNKDKLCIALNIYGGLGQTKREELFSSDVKFSVQNENHKIVFDFKSFSSITVDYDESPSIYHCTIKRYHSSNIYNNDSKFFRLLMPLNEKPKFVEAIESEEYITDSTIHGGGLITIEIFNSVFHLFYYYNEEIKKNYLVVDALNKTVMSDFLESVNSIMLAYGFVTGNLPRDKRYILAYEDGANSIISGILYETLHSSLASCISVFPSSNYIIYFDLPHNLTFPQKIFSKLCEKSLKNSELSRILFLLIEGHTLSTELQATIYYVALEALTNIISEANEKKMKPIPNKKLGQKICKELIGVVNNYTESLTEDGVNTLISKINVIYSATNSQKLLKPFEIYGIELNSKELEAIKKRNDFLHGRIPLSTICEDKKFDLQQISFTVLYCVTALILKYVGYSGFVMYHPTLNEFNKKKKISDFLIKKI